MISRQFSGRQLEDAIPSRRIYPNLNHIQIQLSLIPATNERTSESVVHSYEDTRSAERQHIIKTEDGFKRIGRKRGFGRDGRRTQVWGLAMISTDCSNCLTNSRAGKRQSTEPPRPNSYLSHQGVTAPNVSFPIDSARHEIETSLSAIHSE